MRADAEVETRDAVVFVFIGRLYQTHLRTERLPSHLISLGGWYLISKSLLLVNQLVIYENPIHVRTKTCKE